MRRLALSLALLLALSGAAPGQRPAPRPVVSPVSSGPVITTKALPAGVKGKPYKFQLTATGCPPKGCTWAVSGLPSGLRASSTGLISGTPALTGSYHVTVTVL
jgi:hypothetical protein